MILLADAANGYTVAAAFVAAVVAALGSIANFVLTTKENRRSERERQTAAQRAAASHEQVARLKADHDAAMQVLTGDQARALAEKSGQILQQLELVKGEVLTSLTRAESDLALQVERGKQVLRIESEQREQRLKAVLVIRDHLDQMMRLVKALVGFPQADPRSYSVDEMISALTAIATFSKHVGDVGAYLDGKDEPVLNSLMEAATKMLVSLDWDGHCREGDARLAYVNLLNTNRDALVNAASTFIACLEMTRDRPRIFGLQAIS